MHLCPTGSKHDTIYYYYYIVLCDLWVNQWMNTLIHYILLMSKSIINMSEKPIQSKFFNRLPTTWNIFYTKNSYVFFLSTVDVVFCMYLVYCMLYVMQNIISYYIYDTLNTILLEQVDQQNILIDINFLPHLHFFLYLKFIEYYHAVWMYVHCGHLFEWPQW